MSETALYEGQVRVVLREVEVPAMVPSKIAGAPPVQGKRRGIVQILQQYFEGKWVEVPMVKESLDEKTETPLVIAAKGTEK